MVLSTFSLPVGVALVRRFPFRGDTFGVRFHRTPTRFTVVERTVSVLTRGRIFVKEMEYVPGLGVIISK